MIIVNKGADYSALGLGRAFIPEDQISEEVKAIMAHYADSDIVKISALQEFFNTIGPTIKGKLRNMTLPLFASNIDEAMYDIIQGSILHDQTGANHLSYIPQYRCVRFETSPSSSQWKQGLYYSVDESSIADYSGRFSIIAGTSSLEGPSGLQTYLNGCSIALNDAAVDIARPNTTTNKKIIGYGLVKVSEELNILRVGDTEESDKLTPQDTKPTGFGKENYPFGILAPAVSSYGTRIYVNSDQLLTSEEAKTIRNAVKALDDKIWGA